MAEKYFTPLHTLTYPEVLESKVAVCCSRGVLWGGPDRRVFNAALWLAWQDEVAVIAKTERCKEIPKHVHEYFQATKGLRSAPKEPLYPTTQSLIDGKGIPGLDGVPYGPEAIPGETGTQTMMQPAKKLLENPPRFATSYSGMKDFLNCPAKWAASKYFKTLPYIEGPEAKWGNRAHLAFENFLKGIDTPEDRGIVTEVGGEKYLGAILLAQKNGAQLFVERELCFTKDLKQCGWKDWDTVWFRFKGDVILLQGNKATYVDWKTGKRFSKRGDDQADLFQVEVAWAVISLYHPEIEEFNGRLIYLQEQEPAKAVVGAALKREDLQRIWKKIFDITGRMEQAWETENFRMQTSGLCRAHCGHKGCPHEGK